MAFFSPSPTAPPLESIVTRKILERQAQIETCGWVDGVFSSPVTCGLGSSCAVNTVNRVHNCCPNDNECALPTTCLDSTAVTSVCSEACLINAFVLKCTDLSFPYCFTRYFNGTPPLTGFGCYSAAFTQFVETTYAGEDASAASASAASFWSAVSAGLTTTTTPTQTFESVQGEASTPPSSSSLSSSSSSSLSSSLSSSISSSSSSSSSSPTTSASTHLSGGDIAAIAVAGVIFAGIVLVITFAYRYSTRESRAARRRERDENRKEINRIKLEKLAIKTPSRFRHPPRTSNSPSGQATPSESSSPYDRSTVVGQGLHDDLSVNNSRPSRPPPSALTLMSKPPTAGHYGPMSPLSDTSRPPRPPPSHS